MKRERVASLRRRGGRKRRDLMIERVQRLVRRFQVGFGALAFRLDARELDRALAQGGELARAGESRRARRVVAAHRRFEGVGARPIERRAMGRPRGVARRANLGRGLVAEEIGRARRGRRFGLEPLGFAGLGGQRSTACCRSASTCDARWRNSAVSASPGIGDARQRFRVAAPWRKRREGLLELARRFVDVVARGAEPRRRNRRAAPPSGASSATPSPRSGGRQRAAAAPAAPGRSALRAASAASPAASSFDSTPERAAIRSSSAPTTRTGSEQLHAGRLRPRGRDGAGCRRPRRACRRVRPAARGCPRRCRSGCAARASRRRDPRP